MRISGSTMTVAFFPLLLFGACSVSADSPLARFTGAFSSATAVRVIDARFVVDGDALGFTLVSFRTMGGEQPPITGRLHMAGQTGTVTDNDGCARTFVWTDPDTLTISEQGCPRRAAIAGTYRRKP